MKKGRIVIISGPSGSGKTTLYKKLLLSKKLKNILVKSISVTTRARRPNEKDGRDYFFVSERQFLYKKRAKHFLESQKVFSYYYGTPNKQVTKLLNQGKNVLLCIDVKGGKAVWREHPKALMIFIKTPTLRVLEERLKARGTERGNRLKMRLETAKIELKETKYYDYVIVNEIFNKAYHALENILCQELMRKELG